MLKPSRKVLPLLVLVFLDLLGFGMIIADIQFRATDLGASGHERGLIFSTMFLVQVIFSPFWGKVSDHVSRKPVVVLCTLISAASMFVYAGATSLVWLFVARALAGLGAANIAIGNALFSDQTTPAERLQYLGYISAATQAGLVLGPSIGGSVAMYFGSQHLGILAGCCSLAGALVFLFLMPSGATKIVSADTEPTKKVKAWQFGFSATIWKLLLIASVAWFSLALLEGTFGLLLRVRWGYERNVFGLIFGYESLLTVLTQVFLLKWVSKRITEQKLLMFSYLFQGLGLALMPFMPNIGFILVASTIYAVASSFATPTVNSLSSKLVDHDKQGVLFGVMQSTRTFGFLIGPSLGSELFDRQYSWPYLIAGGTCVAAAGLVIGNWHNFKASRQPLLTE